MDGSGGVHVELKLAMYLKSRFPIIKSFGKRIARSSLVSSRKSSPMIPFSVNMHVKGSAWMIQKYKYHGVTRLWRGESS